MPKYPNTDQEIQENDIVYYKDDTELSCVYSIQDQWIFILSYPEIELDDDGDELVTPAREEELTFVRSE